MDAGYGATYATLYRRHWWWRSREAYLTRLLARALRAAPPGDLLDFGCGDGLYFDVLKQFGEPYGIEPDGALLDPAGPWRARISSEPLTPDATQVSRFRLILALDVLEHIAEPAPVVAELARRLKPGGLMLATVPAFQSLWTTHDVINHHVKRYTVPELEALVASGGLEILESRYFFTWLAFAKWAVVQLERVRHRAPKPPQVPAEPFNSVALMLSRIDLALLGGTRPPFGSSALVLARKAR